MLKSQTRPSSDTTSWGEYNKCCHAHRDTTSNIKVSCLSHFHHVFGNFATCKAIYTQLSQQNSSSCLAHPIIFDRAKRQDASPQAFQAVLQGYLTEIANPNSTSMNFSAFINQWASHTAPLSLPPSAFNVAHVVVAGLH